MDCIAIACASAGFAQTVPPAPVPDRSAAPRPAAAASQPDAPYTDRETDEDPLNIFRAPLLREGSHLVLAKATATRDAKTGEWKLLVDHTDSGSAGAAGGEDGGENGVGASGVGGNGGAPRYELTVLPCARLAEMQRIIESSPDHRVTFQVSGEVLVFRGRNYVLPTYTPVMGEEIVVNVASSPGTATGMTPGASSATAPQTQPATTADSTSSPATEPSASTAPADRSAADISRELEKAAGPLRRSGGATSDQSGNRGESNSPVLPDSRPGSSTRPPTRGAEKRAAAAAGGHPEKLLREGTILTARRGKLSRDGAGGWNFVFDADASGLADPPVRLLPCMLLERIEDYARRVGNNSPALLSGPVYLYGGRNYLLPTVFRIPQDRRNLTP